VFLYSLPDFWQQVEQPASNSEEAQTNRANSLMSFMVFVWLFDRSQSACLFNGHPTGTRG
jgi:hypothetical protein